MSEIELVTAARALRGSLRVPGDKSTSHRALILSALAAGESTIQGLSPGDDVAATSTIVEQLGAIRDSDEEIVSLCGPDDGLRATSAPLDCRNSGTTMRLLCGVLSTVPGEHTLIGDASLTRRPMDRVARPLESMGAEVKGRGPTDFAPLSVQGRRLLRAIEYRVPVASAQVKSAILLAALAGDAVTTVIEDVATRTTTEDMLRTSDVELTVHARGAGRQIELTPGRPHTQHWVVPGDPSQAAFFAVLGAVHGDASLEVLSVDASKERVGYVGVLERMGAAVQLVERGAAHALLSHSSELHATEVTGSEIPSLDEVPVLVVAACAASGVTAFRAMGELRVKESDRFEGSMLLASALGARTWAEGNDFFVEGLGGARAFHEFTFDGMLDHRMVMASAIAGCAGRGCAITGTTTVASSYPSFFRDLALLQ